MITKEKLKETINTIRQLDGNLTLGYFPKKKLTVEGLYGMYYNGWNEIEIGKYYRSGSDYIEITDNNLDSIVAKTHKLLSDCVGDCIVKAVETLKMHDVDLKYFDRDPAKLGIFKKEVMRLKKESIETQKALQKKPKTKSIQRPKLSDELKKPYTPSPELAEIVGSEPLPRMDIVKRVWNYIKKNGLQDTKNRRMINANPALKPIFNNKEQVSVFELAKYLQNHLR